MPMNKPFQWCGRGERAFYCEVVYLLISSLKESYFRIYFGWESKQMNVFVVECEKKRIFATEALT